MVRTKTLLTFTPEKRKRQQPYKNAITVEFAFTGRRKYSYYEYDAFYLKLSIRNNGRCLCDEVHPRLTRSSTLKSFAPSNYTRHL